MVFISLLQQQQQQQRQLVFGKEIDQERKSMDRGRTESILERIGFSRKGN